MNQIRNILFIMADQLRADYLACTGHPYLETPHIDALARRGILFNRAYCQGSTCGSSRASFYTGRYVSSHGATYNNFPLRVDERGMGDYLRPLGLRTAVVGKTHMEANNAEMSRLGIDPNSPQGQLIAQVGFEPYERDDGLHPDKFVSPNLRYNRYLCERGYDSPNPWHHYANAAQGPDGELLSGWYLRHADQPARVREEDSETPYMTSRAIDFMREAGTQPWCLHLSYIKPHWPYIAPAPYHNLYTREQILPANRSEPERNDPHPVVAAFMTHAEGQAFADPQCRATVIPAYMGLIKQIDDQLGRLFATMQQQGCLDHTLIVFSSDHGDYLGDHWLGEKELFHDASVRLPMIIVDPTAAADATRGTVSDALVESIDLLPTFLDLLGGSIPEHILEGRSLRPLLHGETVSHWREAVFTEVDYAARPARRLLRLGPQQARGTMVCNKDWKYIEYPPFRPQLFNLRDDPAELIDLGADPAYAAVRADLREHLYDWAMSRKMRLGIDDARVEARTGNAHKRGIIFGAW